ncbi:MAG: acyltransferase [Clostridia bacterium]|nr:acyltransferase [Clostridia bacterium]
MEISKKENCAIDIMKYVMSVLVIIIHKPVFDNNLVFENYFLQNIIAAVAVPFFFIVSSYFFFSKIDNKYKKSNKNYLFNYEKRLFIIYFLWTIIYAPCIFVKYNSGQYNLLSFKILIGQVLLTIKNFFLSRSFVHFWYLTTLMLSVAIIYFLYLKLNYKQIMIICFALFACSRLMLYLNVKGNVIGQAYSSFLPDVLRNSLEKGLINIAFGLFLSKSDIKIKRSSGFCIGIIVYMFMVVLGILNYNKDSEVLNAAFYVLVALSALSIVILCLKTDIKKKKIYVYLRKSSALIYFSHLLMMSNVYDFIAEKSGITMISESNLFMFISTFVFANIVAALIIHLSKNEKFRFLKYLY